MRKLAVVLVVFLLAAAGLAWLNSGTAALDGGIRVMLGTGQVIADIADDVAERKQGLSGRAGLGEDEGMLFVFQDDGAHGFWMNEMLISVDMIWLDSDKRVVFIIENASPESYPKTFKPSTSSRYVLEVPAGWAKRHNVATGTVASF